MQVENTLSQNLTNADEKASYDNICKEFLANRYILGWILKSCVKEFKDCSVHEIAEVHIEGNPEISQMTVNPDEKRTDKIQGMSTEDFTVNENTIYYDIRFRAVVPGTEERIALIINVEAQNDFYPGYPLIKRGIYYGCRMISSQYETEFSNSHYEKIKKVYSIWICMNPPRYRENTINIYRMTEENILGNVSEKTENYDLITVVMICLANPRAENNAEIIRLLSVLFSAEESAEVKKKVLSQEFFIPMTREVEERIIGMCNLSDGVEQRGIEKGIERGIEQGRIGLIIDALKNATEEQVKTILGVTDEEIQKAKLSLNK